MQVTAGVCRYFNPRLREGGDFLAAVVAAVLFISIHASAKEATFELKTGNDSTKFQSTPPRRRRLVCTFDCFFAFCKFQSTPPRRRRLVLFALLKFVWQFQSTPPRRRRPGQALPMLTQFTISIHASAKEATQ